MSKTEVVELREQQYSAWDHLVENSPQGTIFQRSSWLTACSELLKQELKILGCFQDDTLVAGCSFFTYTIGGLLRLASSVCTMTPYGGVVLPPPTTSRQREQESSQRALIELMCQSVAAYGFDRVQLKNSPGLVDIRPFTWNGWGSKVLYAYCLDTDVDFENHVDPKAMSHIRRAMKAGIMTRKSDDLASYCKLFSMTFQRQGIRPPVTESFLMRMFELLKTQHCGEMWVAETASGETASAEILVWDNKRAYAWSAVSDTELRRTGAASLLLYREFQELRGRGVREYNLMSANFPRLASFNSSFNPRLVPYYEVEKYTLKFDIARRIAVSLKIAVHEE
jgi:hypothetical protein